MNDTSKVPVVAGNAIRAIVPASLDEAYRLAQAFVAGGIAPRGMQRPEQIMVAIMAGLEVGLTPLQAVQGIYIVNGRPQLFGDALVAVVRGSGRCEYIKEGIEGSGENAYAWCETKRRDETEPVRETFSWAQAKRAGLTGKEGPWTQYPARMLKTRARNFCLRDVYADVLRGLSNDFEPETIEVGHITSRDDKTPGDPGIDRQEDVIEPLEPDMPTDKTGQAADKTGQDPDDLPPDPDADEATLAAKVTPTEEPPDDDATGLLAALASGLKLSKSSEDIDELWADLDVDSALTHDLDNLAMAATLRDRALAKLQRAEKKAAKS